MQYSIYGYRADALIYNSTTNTWSLRPDYNLVTHRVQFSVTDDDSFLDGDDTADELGKDSTQTATVYRTNGTVLASGRVYDEEYYGITAPGGGTIWMERIEIGGVHVGWMVSAPLAEGVAYTQTSTGNVYNNTNGDERLYYTDVNSVPCFAPETLIATDQGQIPVEWLRAGDLVVTQDHGLQPVLWIGHFRATAGRKAEEMVEFTPGCLGEGRPAHPLRLSANHRIALSGPDVALHFGEDQVLAAAGHLTGAGGARRITRGPDDPVWHILLARHDLVLADGVWAESLFLGDPCMLRASPKALRRLRAECAGGHRQTARRCLRRYEARLLRPALPTRMPELERLAG